MRFIFFTDFTCRLISETRSQCEFFFFKSFICISVCIVIKRRKNLNVQKYNTYSNIIYKIHYMGINIHTLIIFSISISINVYLFYVIRIFSVVLNNKFHCGVFLFYTYSVVFQNWIQEEGQINSCEIAKHVFGSGLVLFSNVAMYYM